MNTSTAAQEASGYLAELAAQILTRWDMEPKDAVFPCSAVREDLRKALEGYRQAAAATATAGA